MQHGAGGDGGVKSAFQPAFPLARGGKGKSKLSRGNGTPAPPSGQRSPGTGRCGEGGRRPKGTRTVPCPRWGRLGPRPPSAGRWQLAAAAALPPRPRTPPAPAPGSPGVPGTVVPRHLGRRRGPRRIRRDRAGVSLPGPETPCPIPASYRRSRRDPSPDRPPRGGDGGATAAAPVPPSSGSGASSGSSGPAPTCP